ncbi:MAG: ParA family protein [Rhodospirillaceae bacterium]|nr:ParA family protein [Rhodospirillaceae bacterium]
MKTIAFISQKGGVGKTTLATALAVSAHLDGRSAAVIDLDPQASAAFWKDARLAGEPAVTAVPTTRLGAVLDVARGTGCDWAVIDAPPLAKDIAFEAARHADFVLVPTRPAVLDVMAISRTLELITHYGKPSAVVLSLCPVRGREVEDTEAAVRQMGAMVAPVRIHNRIAYSRAQQSGLTAQEFAPCSPAAEELIRLYRYMCRLV